MIVAASEQSSVAGTKAEHWDGVYAARNPQRVSWYQPHLDTSLRLLSEHGLNAESRIIDVGGGASTLVDDLLARGVRLITVADLSVEALQIAQRRLGSRASGVTWLTGDITVLDLPRASYDFWHDRAVLHFLTDEAQARAYARAAVHAVKPGGFAIIAGFAPDGPAHCSGLPVARRSAQEIEALFGPKFALIANTRERHQTPGGAAQSFLYAVLWRLRDD